MNTLSERLLSHAPDRIALRLLHGKDEVTTLDYGALIAGAGRYASALQQAGIQPGEVVVLILQHSADLVFAFWGAILHGAIPSIMPFLTEKLAPEKYRADLASLISITQPAAIVTYPDFADEVRTVSQNTSVRAVLLATEIPNNPLPITNHQSPDSICLLQHSSGTTGLQKGVALSHRAVFAQLTAYTQAIHLQADDVIVSWLPLYHDMGLIAGFVMPLLEGVPLILMSPFDWVRAPAKLLHAVTRYRGTLTWLPNFAYNFCAHKIRERDLAGVDLASWRAVINCSEPMKYESHHAFLQRFAPFGLRESALATCYAMAENVFAVTQGGIDSPVVVDEVDLRELMIERRANPNVNGSEKVKLLSAGRPLPNVKVRVVGEDKAELPERHIGEIALRSDCLLTGYFHRDDATQQAFHEGWYLTGDFGYLADGHVYITGRKKDLIIVGGKNVYPQDLEQIANGVEGVYPGRVVAFGVYDEDAGTEDVAMVAETDLTDPDARQALADAIRKRVTQNSDVALRLVHIVDPRWIIKTSSGKLARSANRDKFLAEQNASNQ